MQHIIFRTAEKVEPTAKKLAEYGVANAEVHSISKTSPKTLDIPQNIDYIVITSTAVIKSIPKKLKTIPCLCVGEETLNQAKTTGFKNLNGYFPNANELADFIVLNIPQKSHICHISADVADTDWHHKLKTAGFTVSNPIGYTTEYISQLPKSVVCAISTTDVNCTIWLFSNRSAKQFIQLAQAQKIDTSKLTALVISPKVATECYNFGEVKIASEPTLKHMLTLGKHL